MNISVYTTLLRISSPQSLESAGIACGRKRLRHAVFGVTGAAPPGGPDAHRRLP